MGILTTTVVLGGLGYAAKKFYDWLNEGPSSSTPSVPTPPQQPSSVPPASSHSVQNPMNNPIAHSSVQMPRVTPSPSPTPASHKPHGGWMDNVVDSSNSVNLGNSFEAYDIHGHAVTLGDQDEKASGGEGKVYKVPQYNGFLAKIYKNSILNDATKCQMLEERIIDMCKIYKQVQGLGDFTAWPVIPLYDSAHASKRHFIGFVMRECQGQSLRSFLGSPRNVQQNFPGITRSDLATIALDLTYKISKLAGKKIYVNDFNPANFLVSKDHNGYHVSLIDCDSYQIPRCDGSGEHITTTYFASMVAPELVKDKSLLSLPRGIHQVEFGTALLVFEILMCGLHPYSHFAPVGRNFCATPDENLLRGRCPLGRGSNVSFPKGNWYNLWSWLTFNQHQTFISMFQNGHANPSERPSLERLMMDTQEFIKLTADNKRRGSEPERNSLIPESAKPKTKRASSTCVA